MKEPRQVVEAKLHPSTFERIEALRGPVSTLWRAATVSDVVRMLILASLERIEQEGLEAVNGVALLGEDEAEDETDENNS